jgi:hypothetical protein
MPCTEPSRLPKVLVASTEHHYHQIFTLQFTSEELTALARALTNFRAAAMATGDRQLVPKLTSYLARIHAVENAGQARIKLQMLDWAEWAQAIAIYLTLTKHPREALLSATASSSSISNGFASVPSAPAASAASKYCVPALIATTGMLTFRSTR